MALLIIITIKYLKAHLKMTSAQSKKNDDFTLDEEDDFEEEDTPMRTQASHPKAAGPALATSTDPNYFDIGPMKKKCQFCNMEVVTYVEHEVNPFFGIGALVYMITFGLLSVIFLPFAFMVTKNAVHRCSRCLQKMGEKWCFGLPDSINDDVSPENLSCSSPF